MGYYKNLQITQDAEFTPEQEKTKMTHVTKYPKNWTATIAPQEKTMNKKTCPICFKVMKGEIFNARPVVEGFCCSDCHTAVVIPTRLKQKIHELETKIAYLKSEVRCIQNSRSEMTQAEIMYYEKLID